MSDFSIFDKAVDDPAFGKKIIKIVVLVIVGILAVCLICNCFSIVGPTERGIRVSLGKADTAILSPGMYFKLPFVEKIQKYSMSPINYGIQFSIGSDSAVTNDMQSVGLTADVFWIYDEAKLYEVITKYTESSLKAAISKAMLASVKESVGKYTIYQIVENQEKIATEITQSLTNKMSSYPIIISQVAISNWDWSQAFDDQIAETMRTTQQVKIAEQELQITQQEAQKQIKEAQAEKEAALIKANAEKEKALIESQTKLETAKLEAEAKKVTADAEAYYNAKLAENLEVELALRELEVRSEEISKWDGKYVSTYQYGPIPVTNGSLLGPTE